MPVNNKTEDKCFVCNTFHADPGIEQGPTYGMPACLKRQPKGNPMQYYDRWSVLIALLCWRTWRNHSINDEVAVNSEDLTTIVQYQGDERITWVWYEQVDCRQLRVVARLCVMWVPPENTADRLPYYPYGYTDPILTPVLNASPPGTDSNNFGYPNFLVLRIYARPFASEW
jgi:hypothetical protein